MGWLREKFKNIESRIDIAGERFEGSITKLKEKERIRKEEKRKHEAELRKRNWENLNWFQKSLKVVVILTTCIIFWAFVGPPLWKFLCKLWQLGIGYQIWKELTG